jgi:hypothetical protein
VERQSNNAIEIASVLFMRKSLNLWADERQLGAKVGRAPPTMAIPE